ncbi:MAG: hypothetical protein AAB583_02470, partial [Patescibacteria group bacterium]
MPRRKKFSLKNLKEISNVKNKLGNLYARIVVFARQKPFTSFLIALGFLFIVILANSLTAPKVAEIIKEEASKEVEVYRIGKSAKTNVLAQVEKTGVITIAAQTPGIVSYIHVSEGNTVWQGKTLISLASNYAGGNAGSISRKLAALQYQNAKDTHDQQKNLINKQREIAGKSDANSDELRSIIDKSLSETRSLIDLNNSIISAIDDSLSEFDNEGLKQLKSQFLNGNNLLKSSLRNAEYQAASDKPLAQLSDLQKDVTIGQLDIQLKALDLSLEVGKLQLALAKNAEAAMFPSSPIGAVVQRAYVSPGQSVNPGTPLIKLSGTKKEVNLSAKVPAKFARRASIIEESVIHIGGKKLLLKPDFVSSEATDGQLYTILFTVPKEYHDDLTDGEYVRIELAIGVPDTGKSMPFIPIDSVFQTLDEAIVYV